MVVEMVNCVVAVVQWWDWQPQVLRDHESLKNKSILSHKHVLQISHSCFAYHS